ncbi:MAG: hypothetical protein ACE5GB_06170 [Acidimicrobiales bacterium]
METCAGCGALRQGRPTCVICGTDLNATAGAVAVATTTAAPTGSRPGPLAWLTVTALAVAVTLFALRSLDLGPFAVESPPPSHAGAPTPDVPRWSGHVVSGWAVDLLGEPTVVGSGVQSGDDDHLMAVYPSVQSGPIGFEGAANAALAEFTWLSESPADGVLADTRARTFRGESHGLQTIVTVIDRPVALVLVTAQHAGVDDLDLLESTAARLRGSVRKPA